MDNLFPRAPKLTELHDLNESEWDVHFTFLSAILDDPRTYPLIALRMAQISIDLYGLDYTRDLAIALIDVAADTVMQTEEAMSL